MSVTAVEPRSESVERPQVGLADLTVALLLLTLSLLPLMTAAMALDGWPTTLTSGGGLIFSVTVIASTLLLVVIQWDDDDSTPMGEVRWARTRFAPWVAVGAWSCKAFDDFAIRFVVSVAALGAAIAGLIALPPGPRLQLTALGNGDIVLGATVVCFTAYLLVWLDGVAERPLQRPGRRAVVALLVFALVLWELRPLWHGVAMLFIQYPLVTWLPLLLGALIAVVAGRWSVRRPATVVAWVLGLALLPSLEARALSRDIGYDLTLRLPQSSQPRLLPKVAAEAYGSREHLYLAHLVVDPSTDDLVWSAEERRGALPFGRSDGIGVQPLGRVDGALDRRSGGFDPAVSAFGPGSLLWRAYRRHFGIRVQDPVIVPLTDGRAVAIAPYVGYRGFLVRRPYWRGVFVYHQDGRLEDLTPAQAAARSDLARSGRLFPEYLARDIAEAHGARVADVPGNAQPYLTNIGDGRIRWITVTHREEDEDALSGVFVTDAATGRTTVWMPLFGRRVLSNVGAARLAATVVDEEGDWAPRVMEPRPHFIDGRLHYLVSVVADRREIAWTGAPPLQRTLLIDAWRRKIVPAAAIASGDRSG